MSARADHRVSRSRSRSPGYTRRHSRSRSRSGSPYQSRGGRSGYSGGAGPSRSRRSEHSRSPMSNRQRHVGSRDAPESSNCVGVFGLSLNTTERELEKEFSKFGPLEKVTVILDGQTGRSRGFAFIYFKSQEDAKNAKEAMSDKEIDGRRVWVDFSITKRAHTPTPGVYMGTGRPTYRGGGGGGGSGVGLRYSRGDGDYYSGCGNRGRHGRGGSGYGRRRSPSPYYRGSGGGRFGRDYRSRSRSYSPR